ncbi:MAG: DUF2007 domain-containing protein [Firmicutes bacterium]|nr:DUF2007 domain-containing protein [Bacillota bacterium]
MDTNLINWVTISEFYDPEEAYLVIGLLEASEIPVKVERETAGRLFGLTVGPLAKITILVPREKRAEVEKILEDVLNEPESPEND